MLNSRLHGLPAAGQSVWSDQISRSMIDSGELERRITEDAISGVTSNPTIFAGAITKGADYDRPLRELAKAGHDSAEILASLVTADITDACDVLRSVWEWSDGGDGFVSVEVSPALAADAEATIEGQRSLPGRCGMPATKSYIPDCTRPPSRSRQLRSMKMSRRSVSPRFRGPT